MYEDISDIFGMYDLQKDYKISHILLTTLRIQKYAPMNRIFFLVQHIKVCQVFKIPVRSDCASDTWNVKSTLKNSMDTDVIIKSVSKDVPLLTLVSKVLCPASRDKDNIIISLVTQDYPT